MRSQRGNALFLILIAVALFAALAYAVTQSGRGSGSIDKEQDLLIAAQITQESASIQTATMRMILTGTPKDTIEYMPATWNTLCTTGVNCLFAQEGGAARLPDPPGTIFEYNIRSLFGFNSHAYVCAPNNAAGCWYAGTSTNIAGIGTTAPDVFLVYPFLRNDICTAINKGLGISGIPVEADTADNSLDAAPGKAAACIRLPGAPTSNTYYHALVEN